MVARQVAVCLAVLVVSGSSSVSAQIAKLNVNVDVNKEIDRIQKLIEGLTKDRDVFRDRNDTWLFFEGDNCTQQVVGSLPRAEGNKNRMALNLKKTDWFKNDEARSVLVQNGKKGDVLFVFDNPDGKTSNDWAKIELLQDVKYLLIGTFEQNFENKFYKITYTRKNGNLNGKISRVRNYTVQ